jgi:hypothetical protein
VQDDDRPTPLVKTTHDAVDEDPVGDLLGWIRKAWSEVLGDVDDLDLDRPSSTAARDVEARVDGQAVDPGVEPVRLAEATQVAPGTEQAILDGIARELAVPEDQAGSRVQPRDRPTDELGEGVMIALPRQIHEPSLVHGHLAR